jgi:hypothetical protein
MPDGVGEADGGGSAVGDAVGDGESVADGESLGVSEGEGDGRVAEVAVQPLAISAIPTMAQTPARRPRKALPVMPYTTGPAVEACSKPYPGSQMGDRRDKAVPPAAETVLRYAKSQ